MAKPCERMDGRDLVAGKKLNAGSKNLNVSLVEALRIPAFAGMTARGNPLSVPEH